MKYPRRLGWRTAFLCAVILSSCYASDDTQHKSEEATCASEGSTNDNDGQTCQVAEEDDGTKKITDTQKIYDPKKRPPPPTNDRALPTKNTRVHMPLNGPVTTTFQNDSPHKVDIYFDDGWFGELVGTVNANDELKLNTFPFFGFFVTLHGAMEILVDSETNVPYKFTISKDAIGKGEVFTLPKVAVPSASTQCIDKYPICTNASNKGECTRNPGWMIMNCCKSCDEKEGFGYLLDSNVRCDPKRLNATKPAWEPGSLNELFTKWATDERYKQYKPHVISSPEKKDVYNADMEDGPWIMVFDNFLDSFEAGQLLEGASLGDGFQQSLDYVSEPDDIRGEAAITKVSSAYRTSSSAWCNNQQCEKLPGVQSLTKRIEEMTGIPKGNYESFQVVQYQEGQYYKPHHDSSNANKDRIAGHRVLTFLLYLNDVGEGGETKFPDLGIAVKPKKGRALVWPSVLNEDPNTSDMRMIHGGFDVTKGTKYTANHWIHQHDFQNTYMWGCSGNFQ